MAVCEDQQGCIRRSRTVWLQIQVAWVAAPLVSGTYPIEIIV